MLFAFRHLLHEHADELASIITAEHGKVHGDALGEIARGLENVEFAAGVPQLMKGGFSEQAGTDVDVYSIRQPLGWWPGSRPFNFPVMVPLWMCANAIACGNAFILKPSEKDPSASLFLARLWQQAGLPDGVFTVLQGDKEAVDALLHHPDVAAISFVGSTPIAKSIYETGTANGKRVQALGGAKNHALVLPDADLDVAADAAGLRGVRRGGRTLHGALGRRRRRRRRRALVDALAVRLPKLVVGDGSRPETDMGPLITREHRDRVASYVDAGEQSGATVVVDGREADVPGDGFFLGATLLDHVTPEMTVYRDEIFGPVLGVVRVETYDEGLALINDNQFAQRHRHLHPRRWRRPPVPVRRRGGHGRHQRADPGAGGLLLVRRLEGLPVRRHPHVRARGHQLLHPRQGRHLALARPGLVERRPRLPADPLMTASTTPPPAVVRRRDHPPPRPCARLPLLVRPGTIDPMPIARAEGSCFWDSDGNRYLDFSSQLVNVNLGHQHPVSSRRSRSRPGACAPSPRSFANDARSRGRTADRRGRPAATWTRCSSPTAAPRPTRTPSGWPGCTPAATRCSPPTAATTAPPRARSR